MLQSYSFSSFSLKYHISDQGCVLALESAVLKQKPCSHLSCWKAIRSSCRVSFIEASKINRSRKKIINSTNLKSLKRCIINAATLQDGCASKSEEEDDDDDHLTSSLGFFSRKLDAFYRFSRPHTVIGTIIGIISVSLLPVVNVGDLTPTFFMGLLKALVPSILMNIYIVGLNQLFDVEIDKVNKPYLPLASGEFSMRTGTAIVSTSLFISLGMGIISKSPPLLFALVIGGLLGTVYSVELPFLRWKRHPFLAASCILLVRALVIQLAFFVHTQKYVLRRPVVITKSLLFATVFMCFFSTGIALFKDIPDIDGDRDFGIQSFSLSLGQERVFWLCVQMLLMAYGAAIMVGASSSFLPTKFVTILGHCTLASALWLGARSIDLSSKASITWFYMFIWKAVILC